MAAADGMLERSDPPASEILSLASFALAEEDAQPDRTIDAMVHNFAAQQLTDGSWAYRGLRRPVALLRDGLGGQFGAGYDPCGAVEVEVEVPAGERRTITFVLGQGRDADEATALLARYADPAAVDAPKISRKSRSQATW